jgi:hypothetical protein
MLDLRLRFDLGDKRHNNTAVWKTVLCWRVVFHGFAMS